MTYGTYRRALPRVRVRKGYHGNEVYGLQASAPPGTNVTILSGQIVYLDANGNWQLANSTNSNGKTPYVAFQDSTDPDVLSSGLLLGLSCAGQYEFSTGYFVQTDGNFQANDLPLIASLVVPGSLTLATVNGVPGGGVGWDDSNDIIGVTSTGGQEQVGPSTDAYGNFIPATNTEALPIGGPTYMLHFTAKWSPKRSVAA
jgi:hypothetical protein